MHQSCPALVSKVWRYATLLRDEGVSYGDYLEQITYLLFLKMDDERENLLGQFSRIPQDWKWDNLRTLSGAALRRHYLDTLDALSRADGMLGTIFSKAQCRIQDPMTLRRLIALIDDETWLGLNIDVKGAIYEGLLERHAAEVRSGAGQYFTPRPLIQAIVRVMRPEPGMTVHDPACGTGGFLLGAYDLMKTQTRDKGALYRMARQAFSGLDIVEPVVRLCAMNLYLHGIGGRFSPVGHGDALVADPGKRYDMVLSNPPFGRKRHASAAGNRSGRRRDPYGRSDFRVASSNKQINFLQHVMTLLKEDGRAAVIVPDNVLYGGGVAERLRKRLLDQFDLHTVLRLPTGVFYRPGIKANVLFFDNKRLRRSPWTREVWFYDARTDRHHTRKLRPLRAQDLDPFVTAFNAEQRQDRVESDRFRRFTYEALRARDRTNLDLFWPLSESLPRDQPATDARVLLTSIKGDLNRALESLEGVARELDR